MQLVSERVTLLDGVKDRRYGPAEVEERFGVAPERILDLRALVGDPSDNIPGVKGIGEKGAAKLIAEWGDLDTLLEHADEVKAKRAREALLEHAEDARLSQARSRRCARTCRCRSRWRTRAGRSRIASGCARSTSGWASRACSRRWTRRPGRVRRRRADAA